MANTKISELSALAAKPADGDLFVINDVSEALDANKTKKITFAYAVKAYADEAVAAIAAAYPSIIPSARAYNNTNISVANNTLVELTFNAERWDTDAIHSTVTNTGRLTCVTAGFYYINGGVLFAANATGQRSVQIRLNGTTNIGGDPRVGAAAAGGTRLAANTVYRLSVGDYVELVVFQNSGGALNVTYEGNSSPEFGMTYLGKAS